MISMALSPVSPACALPVCPLTLHRLDINICDNNLLQVVVIYCNLFLLKYRKILVILYLQTSYKRKQ